MSARRWLAAAMVVWLLVDARAAGQPKPLTDIHGDPLPPGAIGRLGTTRLRGGNFGCFLADGKSLATLSFERKVYRWDIATGKKLSELPAHFEATDNVAFSPDGKRLATADSVAVCVRDLADGTSLKRFLLEPTEKPRCPSIAFSGDGNVLAALTHRERIELWDVETGNSLGTVDIKEAHGSGFGLGEMLLSHDGRRIATAQELHSDDTKIVVWDARTGRRCFDLEVKWFARFAFTADGKWFLALGLGAGFVDLHDVETGRRLYRFEHAENIVSFAVALDGKTLALFREDGRVALWDIAARRELHVLDGVGNGYVHLAYTPDSRKLIAASERGGSIAGVWEVLSGRRLFALDMAVYVKQIAISSDGATVAVQTTGLHSGGAVRMWDLATGIERPLLPGHTERVYYLQISPDGAHVATLDAGNIWLWDTATCEPRARFGEGNLEKHFGFSSDGQSLIAFEPDRMLIGDVAKGVVNRRVRFTGPPSAGSVLSGTGSRRAFGSPHDPVTIVDMMCGAGQTLAKSERLGTWWWGAAFSFDETRFASLTDSLDEQSKIAVRHWRLPGLQEQVPIAVTDDRFNQIDYTRDGRCLIGLGYGRDIIDTGGRLGVVQIWETATGKPVLRAQHPGIDPHVLAVAPNGRHIAVSDYPTGTIFVLELSTLKVLKQFRTPTRACSLKYSPDGKKLYSGMSDTTVLIWDPTVVTPTAPADLSDGELNAGWDALAGNDAGRAYRAIWALADRPKQAITYLATKLEPVTGPGDKQLGRWIDELDSDDFAVRQAAVKALADLSEVIEPVAKTALDNNPTLESRRRLEELLKAIPIIPPPETLRQLRAVQALELIATPEARALLVTLAKGAAGARQTREARESLDRLAKRGVAQSR